MEAQGKVGHYKARHGTVKLGRIFRSKAGQRSECKAKHIMSAQGKAKQRIAKSL